jgi:hypothetical protein
MTDGRSVIMSWFWAHFGTCDHILLPVWKLLSCLCGKLSLMRGQVLQFAVQSLSCPSRTETATILYCLIWDSPQPRGPGCGIYIPQEQGDPVICPGTWKGYVNAKFLMLQLGGLHVKHAVQHGIGYQLRICSWTEENHRKPRSSWLVTGLSRCKLTSSQQSNIKSLLNKYE